jgi:hypothetical protein
MSRSASIIFRHQSNPDNYLHYIRDFLIPIYSFLFVENWTDGLVGITIGSPFPRKFGKYHRIASTLFPGTKFEYVLRRKLRNETTFLLPSAGVHDKHLLSHFTEHAWKSVGITPSPSKVILIERTTLPRDPRIADGRPHVRFLKNHDELKKSISSLCKSKGLPFLNLRPEELTFEEQVAHFSEAKFIVAQHGAGLANLLWMAPRTEVIEIQVSREIPCFKILSASKGLSYSAIPGEPSMGHGEYPILLDHEKGRDEIAYADTKKIVQKLELRFTNNQVDIE